MFSAIFLHKECTADLYSGTIYIWYLVSGFHMSLHYQCFMITSFIVCESSVAFVTLKVRCYFIGKFGVILSVDATLSGVK